MRPFVIDSNVIIKKIGRPKFLLGLFLSLLGFYLALRFGPLWYLKADARVPGDFNVYWIAAERLSQGQRIYWSTDESPFKYSPTYLYLFRYSFFFLEHRLAAALWTTLSLITYFGALLRLGGRLLIKTDLQRRVLAALCVGVALSWQGFLETLSYGQVDLLLGAGILWITASTLDDSRRGTSRSSLFRVLLWALILIVKPHMLLILLPACFAFGWRECLSVLSATALMYVVPALWIGPTALLDLFREWFLCLREQQDYIFMIGNINQSMGAVTARLSGQLSAVGTFNTLFVGLYLVLSATLFVLRRNRFGDGSKEEKLCWLAYGVSGYLLVSPLSWRWFVFLWVPLVAIMTYVDKKTLTPLLAWALLAVLTKKGVSPLLGVNFPDWVSFVGLYMWASFVLFSVAFSYLRRPSLQSVG
ncbi:MAG: hypothetical protein A2X94_09410 [Bdellovibrionales bacterium GWB1_55_8]|nr:MAG: hypothetical protein A2X94_09410 [Bdellovibrionales bacterium GWB1_55_8]